MPTPPANPDRGTRWCPRLPPRPCHRAPNPANRFGLPLNVGEHGPAAVWLQPLVDEGPKYHLEAHHTLELARRLAGEDPSPVQQCLGENEHGPCLVREHRYFRLQRGPLSCSREPRYIYKLY